jgi:hypothetical protein
VFVYTFLLAIVLSVFLQNTYFDYTLLYPQTRLPIDIRDIYKQNNEYVQ